MEKICGIYCIENLVNEKKYIGQSIDVMDRLADHRSRLRSKTHKNLHLQSSWNTQDDEFGYNIEPGGHTNKTMSDETKVKISKALTGRKLTDEHKQKIIAIHLGSTRSAETRKNMSNNHADVSGENNPNYGKHLSEETKQKIRENRRVIKGEEHPNYGKIFSDETKAKMRENHADFSGSIHPQCRPVYCPEVDREFWGAKEVELELGIDATYIAACLRGRQKSAGKHPSTGEKLHWVDAKERNLAS